MPASAPSPLAPLGLPPLRPAAVIHGAGSLHVDSLLDDFSTKLKQRGFAVGGVIQRNVGKLDDCAQQMLLVDIATGTAFDITQKLGTGSRACRVDPREVVEAGSAVRRAIAGKADLIIVNKFAGLEAGGEGLADEILDAMASGIPVLTSVGSRYLNEWHAFTGGLAELLPPDPAALWRWWGPHRLYRDLVNGVADTDIRRVLVGAKWVAVETATALGLSARPPAGDTDPSQSRLEELCRLGLRGLAEFAATAWDPLDAAIGMAAVNAHFNTPDQEGQDLAHGTANGLDGFAVHESGDAPLVVVGAFPDIGQRRPGARIVDYNPAPGQYPESASDWLLPACGAALLTASSLANRTLPRLLTAAAGKPAALVGPGTPLTPRLFAYGLTTLSGFVVTDRTGAAEAIVAGAASRDFRPFGRRVTLTAPGA